MWGIKLWRLIHACGCCCGCVLSNSESGCWNQGRSIKLCFAKWQLKVMCSVSCGICGTHHLYPLCHVVDWSCSGPAAVSVCTCLVCPTLSVVPACLAKVHRNHSHIVISIHFVQWNLLESALSVRQYNAMRLKAPWHSVTRGGRPSVCCAMLLLMKDYFILWLCRL